MGSNLFCIKRSSTWNAICVISLFAVPCLLFPQCVFAARLADGSNSVPGQGSAVSQPSISKFHPHLSIEAPEAYSYFGEAPTAVVSAQPSEKKGLLDYYLTALAASAELEAGPYMDMDFGFIPAIMDATWEKMSAAGKAVSARITHFFNRLERAIEEGGGYTMLDLDEFSL